MGAASQWKVEHRQGHLVFKSMLSGRYMNVEGDGGEHAYLWTSTNSVVKASQWYPEPKGPGKFALRNVNNGKYMNVKGDGGSHSYLWCSGNGDVPASVFEPQVHGVSL